MRKGWCKSFSISEDLPKPFTPFEVFVVSVSDDGKTCEAYFPIQTIGELVGMALTTAYKNTQPYQESMDRIREKYMTKCQVYVSLSNFRNACHDSYSERYWKDKYDVDAIFDKLTDLIDAKLHKGRQLRRHEHYSEDLMLSDCEEESSNVVDEPNTAVATASSTPAAISSNTRWHRNQDYMLLVREEKSSSVKEVVDDEPKPEPSVAEAQPNPAVAAPKTAPPKKTVVAPKAARPKTAPPKAVAAPKAVVAKTTVAAPKTAHPKTAPPVKQTTTPNMPVWFPRLLQHLDGAMVKQQALLMYQMSAEFEQKAREALRDYVQSTKTKIDTNLHQTLEVELEVERRKRIHAMEDILKQDIETYSQKRKREVDEQLETEIKTYRQKRKREVDEELDQYRQTQKRALDAIVERDNEIYRKDRQQTIDKELQVFTQNQQADIQRALCQQASARNNNALPKLDDLLTSVLAQ